MNEQPAAQPEKKGKKTEHNIGWVWLAIAFIGIGVLFFGFAGLTDN